MRALVVFAAAAAVLTAGCSSLSGSDHPPAGVSQPATSTAPAYGQPVLDACREARKAAEGPEGEDQPGFLLAGRAAVRGAAGSTVGELQEIARKVTRDVTSPAGAAQVSAAVFAIHGWCASHGVTG